MKLALVSGHILEVLNCITHLTCEYHSLIKGQTAFRMTRMHLSWISICSHHQLDMEPSLGHSFLIYKKSQLINSSPRPIPAKILLVSSM